MGTAPNPRPRRVRVGRSLIISLPLSIGFALTACMPDFSSLSSGELASAGGAGRGGSPEGGGLASEAGAASGGSTTLGGHGGTSAGSGGRGGAAGTAGSGGEAGKSSAGEAGAAGLNTAGEAGSGATDPCAFAHSMSAAFDVFNTGLSGTGFELATATATNVSTHQGTSSAGWDASIGLTCAGAWHLTADFKGYSPATTTELAIGDLRFSPSNWTGHAALHAWVKVEPTSAPIQGVQFFLVSDFSKFLYESSFDESVFRNGRWNEMVLSLAPNANCNPAQVIRIGIQLALQPAGTSGNPATPPVTDVWMDDVWVE